MKKAMSYLLIIALLSAFSFVAAQTSGGKVADTDDNRSMNWPGGSTIARASNGELMLIYGTIAGPDSTVYAVSYDDFVGAWNAPVALGRGTGEGRVISHANIVADADNNFHAAWSSNWNIVHSMYNGTSWSTPVSVTGTAAPWDTLRAAHTALSIDSDGNPWVIFSTGWENDDASEYVFASKSTDDGAIWSTPDTLFNDILSGSLPNYSIGFPHVATGPGGKVGVTIRGPKGLLGQYTGAVQEFDGTSWGASEYLQDASGAHVFADSVDVYQLSMDYDASGNRHFAFYTAEADFDNTDDGQIYYSQKGTDNAWTNPVAITSMPGGAADYPSIVYGGNDDLYIAFLGTADSVRRVFGVNSADLGATWTGAIQLSFNTVGLDLRAPSVSQTIGSGGADVAWIQPEGDAYAIYYGLIPKAVVSVDHVAKPENYNILRNYPNPFNPSTIIEFGVSEASNVRLSIYNTLGQEIAQLVNQKMNIGIYEITFNATHLSSGIYFYRLDAGSQSITNKLLYLK